jgi:hypothetical protein
MHLIMPPNKAMVSSRQGSVEKLLKLVDFHQLPLDGEEVTPV